jgi:hypothetical protein
MQKPVRCYPQLFTLTSAMHWPARMPRLGTLEVDFQTKQFVADRKLVLLDEHFQHIFGATLSAEAPVSDTHRATLCMVRCCDL